MNKDAINDVTPPSNRGVTLPPLASVAAGVDWLTVTTQDDQVGLSWLTKYKLYTKQNPSFEMEKTIKGFTGIGVDTFSWLYNPRDSWYMVILTGATARELWTSFVSAARNVTRIDLAVTVLLAEANTGILNTLYGNLSDADKDARRYTILNSTNGGTTLYVGSRASANFGRIYDKGSEQGSYQPGNLYRYEVELKKPQSFTVANDIANRVLINRQQEKTIYDYVYSWFYSRGLTPVFSGDEANVLAEIDASVSLVDRRLSWLKRSVRPTVRELLKAGLTQEVVDALGLANYVQLGFSDVGGQ